MHLKKIIEPVLLQLSDTLTQISDDDYNLKCTVLNNNSIGGHTRHIIELFQCLFTGYQSGTVNYERRKRDMNIESNRVLATNLLQHISSNINLPDKQIKLEGVYSEEEKESCIIETNYYREVLYNIEHAIHHMALIRIGINEISSIQLPDNFGVAASTMQHKKICVQ
jgi:hypothetical protein